MYTQECILVKVCILRRYEYHTQRRKSVYLNAKDILIYTICIKHAEYILRQDIHRSKVCRLRQVMYTHASCPHVRVKYMHVQSRYIQTNKMRIRNHDTCIYKHDTYTYRQDAYIYRQGRYIHTHPAEVLRTNTSKICTYTDSIRTPSQDT